MVARQQSNIVDLQTRLHVAAKRYRFPRTNTPQQLMQRASHTARFAYFVGPAAHTVQSAWRSLTSANRDESWRSVRTNLVTGAEQNVVLSADWPDSSFVATSVSASESRIAFVVENAHTGERHIVVGALPDDPSAAPLRPRDLENVRNMPPHVTGVQWLDEELLYVTYGRNSSLVPDAVILVDTANHSSLPLFVEDEPDRVLDVQLTQDSRFVLLRSESHRNTEWRIVGARRDEAVRGFDRVVFPRQFDSDAVVRHEHQRLWISHDVGRLRGCVEQLDTLADDAAFDWRNRVPVVTSLPQLSIDYFDVFDKHLLLYATSTDFGLPAVAVLRDFSELDVHRMPPHVLNISAPQRSTHAKQVVFFSHPLFGAQERVHTVDLETLAFSSESASTCLFRAKPFDIDEHIVVEHHTVPSNNGADVVQVPMIIVRARDTPVDGTGKCMQYVYGAYGDKWPFQFGFVELEAMLSEGWTLALCGVRGGGELGTAWADAGVGEHRSSTFIDATSCGKWLIERGYAARDALCIAGRSAGGLTAMGAVARDPTLYAVLIGIKPLVAPGEDGSAVSPVDANLFGSFRPLDTLPALLSRLGTAFPSVWLYATEEDEHAPSDSVDALVHAMREELEDEDTVLQIFYKERKTGAHDEPEGMDVMAEMFAYAQQEVSRRRELKQEAATRSE